MTEHNYIPLHLKYRPSDLIDLKGQEHVTCLLDGQLKNNTLPNCLLFYGTNGVGKTSFARIIAKTLNEHPSGIIEVDSALDGGKDSIKNIQQDMYNYPLVGEYKTYIFDEAHELTRQSFASLLKTLEEPPSHVKFILITNNFDKIPLSIRSRSQSHHFCNIPTDIIKSTLIEICNKESRVISDSILDLAVFSAGGSLRNALMSLEIIFNCVKSKLPENKIADTLGVLGNKRLSEFILAYVYKDFFELHNSIKYFYSENINPQRAIYELQQFIMDCRLYFIDPSLSKELHTDLTDFLASIKLKTKKKFTDLSIQERKIFGAYFDKIYDISINTESFLSRTQNKQALFTRFLIQLATSWND